MSAAILRRFEPGDLAPLTNAWNRSLVRDTTTEGRFAQWLVTNPDFDPVERDGAWVAEADGKAIGFIRAWVRTWPNDTLGIEPDKGWIPCMFVAPEHQRLGIGTQLMNAALEYFRAHGRRQIWICGGTGSAPGYIFPGVDKDAYAGGASFFKKHGFIEDHEAAAMARSIIDLNFPALYAEAWRRDENCGIRITGLDSESLLPLLAFLRQCMPGDWSAAARARIKAGGMDSFLLAWLNGEVVGYCQWDGEHFGPFAVNPAMRNKRVGAKLFVEAMRRIKASDGRTVWFNWADPDVQRFYQRMGMEITRRFAIMKRNLA